MSRRVTGAFVRGATGRMSVAEERDCLARAKRGDATARDALVRSALKFVALEANRLSRRYRADPDDLLQEGVLGLLRAIELYDMRREVRFLSYAVHLVATHFRDWAIRERSLVRIGKREADVWWVRNDPAGCPRLTGDSPMTAARQVTHETEPADEALDAARNRARAEAAIEGLPKPMRGVLRRRMAGEKLREIGKRAGFSREWVRVLEARAVAQVQASALPDAG